MPGLDYRNMMDSALTISLALLAGIVAQTLAHHLRIPGIVLLLVFGVVLGPDLINVIHPQTLGLMLQALIGYAVAVILFEGGLNLNLGRLKRESVLIRRLITWGALVTALAAAVASKLIIGWEWRLAILFGTLVIVTGPTVITPLLKRIRINRSLHTVLEAEGVLIDPIGAIIAIVTLEVMLSPSSTSVFQGAIHLVLRLGAGAIAGVIGGAVLGFVLKPRYLIPAAFVNVFTLSSVLALYHVSDLMQPESGIVAVTVAGMVMGNMRTRVQRELMEFKEQLTVLFIGMLFVLLAADVRVQDIRELGVAGLLTVGAIIFVIRPLNVAVSTPGSGMPRRERIFLSWLAPRGIVAAGVASFFAVALDAAGIPGGPKLRALVFLVIAVTVTVQGLTAGVLANLLGVRRKTGRGFAILGANELSRALGRALQEGDEEVLLIDSNPDIVKTAEKDGFRVVLGNAFEDRTLLIAQLDSMAGCIGLTPNEEVNLLFATETHKEHKAVKTYVALHATEGHVTPEMIHRAGANVLFGRAHDIDLWTVRFRRKLATVEWWRCDEDQVTDIVSGVPDGSQINRALFPAVIRRNKRTFPIDDQTQIKKGDLVCFFIFAELYQEAASWLKENGWTSKDDGPA